MVCLQETADFVSVEIVWLGQSPGHRRLRFSFQFNDVKDPTGEAGSTVRSPAAAEEKRVIERQRAAEAAIEGDPEVRAFKEAFGATVRPGSVQPVDGK